MRKNALIFCLLALLGVLPCLGAETYSPPGLDSVWEQAEEYGIGQGTGLEAGLAGLASRGLEQLGGLFRASVSTALKLAAVVVLCALAEGVQPQTGGLQPVSIAGALAITALTMTDMAVMIGLGRDTMGRMEDRKSVV